MDVYNVTWTFLEAAHGKGPADGIGAAVKCAADRLVANGHDILNANQMLEGLKNVKVQMNTVSTEK